MVPRKDNYIVVSENGREFNANLLCVGGGHNKYYVLQLLKKGEKAKKVTFYRRWGACGQDGHFMTKDYDTLEEAISDFDAMLDDKLQEYTEVVVTYP